MAKNQIKHSTLSVDMGQLQMEVIDATMVLKAAQQAKLKADQIYTDALSRHERAKVSLNAGVAAVKSEAQVDNLYAN
jgi:hypothetical protein